jgi:hypothetical protein
MPTPSESRAALALVTGAAVEAATRLLGSLSGSPESKRTDLLGVVPEVIAYYSDGSSALAADFYDDERDAAGARGLYVAEPVILDRGRKIGNAIAWAAEPLITGDGDAVGRLAEVVQLETARPYRDTITTNRQRDPAAVGWRRVSSGGCKFCRMLADRGAVFKESTARFASHENCNCTAQPVFETQDGPEASVMQYVASKRRRTAKERQALREYLAALPD